MRGVLVDAGPLVALIEAADRNHNRCIAALKTLSDPLLTVWPAFTEAMYLLGGSARSQDALWGMVESGGLEFASLTEDDAAGLHQLMQRYRDQPMDLADAAIVHVADREDIRRVFTLDRRHFSVYRIRRRTPLSLLP